MIYPCPLCVRPLHDTLWGFAVHLWDIHPWACTKDHQHSTHPHWGACPVCKKVFHDWQSFASHVAERHTFEEMLEAIHLVSLGVTP